MEKQNTQKPPTLGMNAFNIKAKSDEGVKLTLSLPDGTPTNEYLVVLGADSRVFRSAQAKTNRKNLSLLKDKNMDPADQANRQAENLTELVAELIVDWSFSEECIKSNKVTFLRNSPQIQEEIDRFAGNRQNFFDKPPKSCSNTPKGSSSSTQKSKVAT